MAIRLLQVGMGGWGRNWLHHVLRKSKEFEVVAWVEAIPQVLERAAQEFSLPQGSTFTDLAEALAKVECDAVLVTASLTGHIPLVLTALKAGKHVLVEKPFAPTLAEARAAVELAEQLGRTLMVSQNYRFFPAIQATRELLHSGKLGKLGSIHLKFRRYANTAPKGQQAHYEIWQPLLADMSIHHFDLMRYILGQEASSVFCEAWNQPWSNFRDPETAAAIITFEDGTVVDYSGSWVSPGPKTHWAGEWRFECAEAEIAMCSRDDEMPEILMVRMLGQKEEQHIKLPDIVETDRLGSLHAFAQAIRGEQEPSCSGRDNLQTLALMLAAIESSRQRLPIKLL